MKPPKVSSFHVKIVVKPSKISKQVNETRSQKKKMRGFYLKPKKLKLWGWISRWRPVDRRFAPIDRGRHREIQPLGCENLGGTPNP